MSRSPTWLLEHKRDRYSQTGEDGIIEKILEVIRGNDKWCVEFGAWDGLYLTNTRNLIEAGYSAVLVEADPSKFRDLQRNYRQRSNVTTLNAVVGFSEDDNLDKILSTTAIPSGFDLLSIDIDGNDYHVWKAMSRYTPKVIVVEFNPTIPTEVRFVQPADLSTNQGASLLSLVELGKEKGYELVSVLLFNAFFVRKEYYPLFELKDNAPRVLRTDVTAITYLFSGYDGTVFLRGACKLPWHDVPLRQSRYQSLPRIFRRFPGNFTKLHIILFALYRRGKLMKRFGTPLGARP